MTDDTNDATEQDSTIDDTEEQADEYEDADVPHLVKYLGGSSIYIRTLGDDGRFGAGHRHPRYRLIDDDETFQELTEYESAGGKSFRGIPGAELEEALGSAKEAVETIAAGEHDGVLDMLLVAEREAFGNRVTVLDALVDRKRAIEAQRQAEAGDVEGALNPEELAGL